MYWPISSERIFRLEEQRKEKRSNQAKADDEGNISNGNSQAGPVATQHDLDMLEMTLGMLRCSVCKDRFKSVTIKKCFHLFCKECIDENIRNRSRKCPACGEKFGHDDVANIYFTH
jgi:E3 ubiquitin-protein ligase BRE1